MEEATTATGGRRRTAARTGAPEGEKKRYCCSSAAASDSIYGFGAKGDAPPGGKIDPPGDGAADLTRVAAGSHLELCYHVTGEKRKGVNWSDVYIDRGPLGYIYEYKRR